MSKIQPEGPLLTTAHEGGRHLCKHLWGWEAPEDPEPDRKCASEMKTLFVHDRGNRATPCQTTQKVCQSSQHESCHRLGIPARTLSTLRHAIISCVKRFVVSKTMSAPKAPAHLMSFRHRRGVTQKGDGSEKSSVFSSYFRELQTHPKQPCLSRVKGRSSPARGGKFGCVCVPIWPVITLV